jgi:hypothetical protein
MERDSENYLEIIVDNIQEKINHVNDVLSFPQGRLVDVLIVGIDDEGHLYAAGTPNKKLSLKLVKDLKKQLKQWNGKDY